MWQHAAFFQAGKPRPGADEHLRSYIRRAQAADGTGRAVPSNIIGSGQGWVAGSGYFLSQKTIPGGGGGGWVGESGAGTPPACAGWVVVSPPGS